MTSPSTSGAFVTRQPVAGGPVEGPIPLHQAAGPDKTNWFEIRGSGRIDQLTLRFPTSGPSYRYTLQPPTESIALIGPAELETSATNPLSAAFAETQLNASPQGQALRELDALLRSIERGLNLRSGSAYTLRPRDSERKGFASIQWILAFKYSSEEYRSSRIQSSSGGAETAQVEPDPARRRVENIRQFEAESASEFLRFLHALAHLALPDSTEARRTVSRVGERVAALRGQSLAETCANDRASLEPYRPLISQLLAGQPSIDLSKKTATLCANIADLLQTTNGVDLDDVRSSIQKAVRLAAYENPGRLPALNDALRSKFGGDNPFTAATGWNFDLPDGRKLSAELGSLGARWKTFREAYSDKVEAERLKNQFLSGLLSKKGPPADILEAFEKTLLASESFAYPFPTAAAWILDGTPALPRTSDQTNLASRSQPPPLADCIAVSHLFGRGSASLATDPYRGYAFLTEMGPNSYRLRTSAGERRWNTNAPLTLEAVRPLIGNDRRLVVDDALWEQLIKAHPQVAELSGLRIPSQDAARALRMAAFAQGQDVWIDGVGRVQEIVRVNRRPDSDLSMWAIQLPDFGDAIILRFPDGRTLVVDTGFSEDACKRIMAALNHLIPGQSTIDILITHPHLDHAGGFSALLQGGCVPPEGLTIGNVIIGHATELNESQVKLLRDLRDKKRGFTEQENLGGPSYKVFTRDPVPLRGGLVIENRTAAGGPIQHLAVSGIKGAQLDVYQVAGTDNHNDASLVVRVEYEGTSLLLTGDIGYESMRKFADWNQPLNADIMKHPHHVSFPRELSEPKKKAWKDFVSKVSPVVVFFSNYGRGQNQETEERAREFYRSEVEWSGGIPPALGGTNPRHAEVDKNDVKDADTILRVLRGRAPGTIPQAVYDAMAPEARGLLAQSAPPPAELISDVVKAMNAVISGESLELRAGNRGSWTNLPTFLRLRELAKAGNSEPLNRWLLQRAFEGALKDYEPGGTYGALVMMTIDPFFPPLPGSRRGSPGESFLRAGEAGSRWDSTICPSRAGRPLLIGANQWVRPWRPAPGPRGNCVQSTSAPSPRPERV